MVAAATTSGCGFISDAELLDRLDADGDGLVRSVDCDDTDPAVTTYLYFVDIDQDSYGDDEAPRVAGCEAVPGLSEQGGDCDDTRPDVHPRAIEKCNRIDDNCDLLADNDVADPGTFYQDADGDGVGDSADSVEVCFAPDGYVAVDGDCDDTDPETVGVSTWYLDGDGDGWGDPHDTAAACEAPSGRVGRGGDCNDTDPAIHPDATEVCSGGTVDEDCDGLINDDDPDNLDPSDGIRVWLSADGDRYGNPLIETMRCAVGDGWVENRNDCDDRDPENDNADCPFLEISAGGSATCAVRGDARLECWGAEAITGEGKLPDGIFTNVAVGYDHACGLTSIGTLDCWGNLDSEDRFNTEEVLSGVSAGGDYTCALAIVGSSLDDIVDDTEAFEGEGLEEQDLQCWAADAEYRLGVADQEFARFDAGNSHACGLLEPGGNVRCIGECDSGECASQGTAWTDVATGRNFTCATSPTSGAACWGDHTTSPPDGAFSRIAAFGWNICAATNGGVLQCWTSKLVASALAPPAMVFDKWDVGALHGCGINPATGQAVCWGDDRFGQASPP